MLTSESGIAKLRHSFCESLFEQGHDKFIMDDCPLG